MRRMVYIVICACNNGDERFHIDSAWTSSKKAEKRKRDLNNLGFDYLQEEYGWGLFEVIYQILDK